MISRYKFITSLFASIYLFTPLISFADIPPREKTKTTESAKADLAKADAAKAAAAAKEAKAEAKSKAPKVVKRVYFTSPADQAKVKSPVSLTFGVDGMSIRPAGEDVKDKTSGHHHLIIDADGIKAGSVVPMDKQHIHYGKGQTSATVELTPGEHTLRLQFADGAHRSYGAEMSAAIKVTVVE